ncbi:MAG: outer membrane lipoprotein-sorting protein [Cytophagales bacterium]|nr:outer membrane lipoprotein-sorting protein [Cytophagales bacterium]
MQMNRILLIILCGLPGLVAQGQEAREVVRRADEKMRGSSSFSEMTIEIVRPKWRREMQVKSWTRGTDYSLTLVTAPAKEKGNAFLKRGMEIWSYNPAIERTIKLPPSMMMQSWMGTDMTNDDFVKQSSVVDDFTHRMVGEESVSGQLCYKIELLPREDAAVVWGKLLLWIDKKEYMQMKTEFYDEDGYLVNTLVGSEVKLMGGKLLPTRMEMIPEENPGNKTVMTYTQLTFGQDQGEAFYTTQNMRKVR